MLFGQWTLRLIGLASGSTATGVELSDQPSFLCPLLCLLWPRLSFACNPAVEWHLPERVYISAHLSTSIRGPPHQTPHRIHPLLASIFLSLSLLSSDFIFPKWSRSPLPLPLPLSSLVSPPPSPPSTPPLRSLSAPLLLSSGLTPRELCVSSSFPLVRFLPLLSQTFPTRLVPRAATSGTSTSLPAPTSLSPSAMTAVSLTTLSLVSLWPALPPRA